MPATVQQPLSEPYQQQIEGLLQLINHIALICLTRLMAKTQFLRGLVPENGWKGLFQEQKKKKEGRKVLWRRRVAPTGAVGCLASLTSRQQSAALPRSLQEVTAELCYQPGQGHSMFRSDSTVSISSPTTRITSEPILSRDCSGFYFLATNL